MRYYTKEWYELMQRRGLCAGFRKIPDGHYTDREIMAFRRKAERKMIAEERRAYDTPPVAPDLSDLTEENFVPEDWLIFNEDGTESRRPASAAEVRADIEEEYRTALEAFRSRPPFDPAEAIEIFSKIYHGQLTCCRRNYPTWLTDSVDHRLIALDLLPASAYERFRLETKAAKKKWDAIERAARKALSREDIPERIGEALSLHDATVVSVRKRGDDLIMTVLPDGIPTDGEPSARRVVFRDARILENEIGSSVRKGNTCFLYDEIYQNGTGYEIHMMFWHSSARTSDLRYLTLACSDVDVLPFSIHS